MGGHLGAEGLMALLAGQLPDGGSLKAGRRDGEVEVDLGPGHAPELAAMAGAARRSGWRVSEADYGGASMTLVRE